MKASRASILMGSFRNIPLCDRVQHKIKIFQKSTQTEEIENCKLGQYPRSAGWTKYREKEIELEKLKIARSKMEETLKSKISKLEEELKSRQGLLQKST